MVTLNNDLNNNYTQLHTMIILKIIALSNFLKCNDSHWLRSRILSAIITLNYSLIRFRNNVHTQYGVATVSRIDKIIGLFCKRDL